MRRQGRSVWGIILVLVVAGLIWVRHDDVMQAGVEPWVYGGALLLAGQAAGRILRTLRKDPLPLWLGVLVAGAVPAMLSAPGEGALPVVVAGLAWGCGLGLAGFPAGFEV